MLDVFGMPYLYTERVCSAEGKVLDGAVASALREVDDFMRLAAIPAAGPAVSLYSAIDGHRARVRAGFLIVADDMAKASGNVRADITFAGKALYAEHLGPRETLRDTWARLRERVVREGRKVTGPAWELYLDEPDARSPAKRRTELYLPIA